MTESSFLSRKGYEDLRVELTRLKKLKKEMSEESKNDLLRALKFVLERRRVSYDLLKTGAEFGNQAADILSRLEVEGFIRKPDGTNRWEVFTDKIEEFLAKEEKSGE